MADHDTAPQLILSVDDAAAAAGMSRNRFALWCRDGWFTPVFESGNTHRPRRLYAARSIIDGLIAHRDHEIEEANLHIERTIKYLTEMGSVA
jgi:hypothetical protein